jgi:hypothetical protein
VPSLCYLLVGPNALQENPVHIMLGGDAAPPKRPRREEISSRLSLQGRTRMRRQKSKISPFPHAFLTSERRNPRLPHLEKNNLHAVYQV